MKLRGISPMQPICEICDEALDHDEVGKIFQNSFYHEGCFHRARQKDGGELTEPADRSAHAIAASVE